jgi:cardiolipin synthase
VFIIAQKKLVQINFFCLTSPHTLINLRYDSMWKRSSEDVMHWLWFLIIGVVAGWLSGKLTRGRDFGVVGDLVVGILGALVGGFLFRLLGVVSGSDRFACIGYSRSDCASLAHPAPMRTINVFCLTVVLASAIIFGGGCATLPKVAEVVDEAPADQESPQILASKGFLSPKQSKTVIERLKQRVDPTDIMERETALMESVGGSPLIKGNKVSLLVDGPATSAAMFNAVENAKDHINIETFIFEGDEMGGKLADMLLQKQSEGVQVNIIYDSLGSLGTPGSFFDHLKDGGIHVLEFNPVNPAKFLWRRFLRWQPTHRDHRKILIVDGKVAITGGVNISGVYSSRLSGREEEEEKKIPWRDTDIQIEGPAVAELQKLFLDTWQREKGPHLAERNFFPQLKEVGGDLVQVVGSTPGAENRLTFIMYVSAITFSENSVHLTNSYFVPDNQTLKALTDAARRGVDVKIILARESDSSMALYAGRYYYSDLLKSGAKLYERRDAILHAKTAVIDDVWATVGSTNMDFWSFLHNDEANVIILSPSFADEMEKMFNSDLQVSNQIHWEEWKERPLFPRIREWLMHLLSRWL